MRLVFCYILTNIVILTDALQLAAKADETSLNYIQNVFSRDLMLLQEPDRIKFLSECGEDACDTDDIRKSDYKWQPSASKQDKERFLHSYSCNIQRKVELCPVDGHWGTWTLWSTCTADCYKEGRITRTRQCNNPPPRYYGRVCAGPYKDTKSCRKDCETGSTPFTGHSLSSASSEKENLKYMETVFSRDLLLLSEESRGIFISECGNKPCHTSEIRKSKLKWNPSTTNQEKDRFYQSYKCNINRKIELCPVDGDWGAWTQWSNCSAKCDLKGKEMRTRLCNNPVPQLYGQSCYGHKEEKRTCKKECSKGHNAIHEAKMFVSAVHNGFPNLEKECSGGHCTYDQLSHYLNGIKKEKYWASLQCTTHNSACPVDGGWSTWASWSSCQPLCGLGTMWRERFCTHPKPSNGGYQCVGKAYEENQCIGKTCSNSDLLYGHYLSDWTEFSSCSVSCGKYGVQMRRRVCLKPYKCVHQLLSERLNEITIEKPCYYGECPVEGGWSSWGKFSFCSAKCGNGRKMRVRMCNNPFPRGSAECIGNEMYIATCKGPCNQQWKKEIEKSIKQSSEDHKNRRPSTRKDTPGKGDVFEIVLKKELENRFHFWSQWTPCSKSCEGGYRWRERFCKNSTSICRGEIHQNQFCNTNRCPVVGGWSGWTTWTICSMTCGNGYQMRYRKCDNPYPQAGGDCFGISEETKACSIRKCKGRIFKFGEWGSWSSCTSTCGKEGKRWRKRACIIKPKSSKMNSAKERVKRAYTDVKNSVETIGLMPAALKKEKRRRRREVKGQRTKRVKGKLLKVLPEREFNKPEKYIFTPKKVSSTLRHELGVLGKCSVTGTTAISRCNVRTCPVDGQWSNWGSWSGCSKTCGEGVHVRSRSCTDPFPNGGQLCEGQGSEIAHCFPQPCPDSADQGIMMKGKGVIAYRSSRRVMPFLVLYMLFKPKSDSGTLIHRYRGCHGSVCQHELRLVLEDGRPKVTLQDGKTVLQLKYKSALKMDIWHSVFIYMSDNGGFMRIDDGFHFNATFSTLPVKVINFDAKMTVGWDRTKSEKQGFHGVVASIRVNFVPMSLSKEGIAKGYGLPAKVFNVRITGIEPTVAYPKFSGRNYVKLDIFGTKKLSIKFNFMPLTVNGLLLLNLGHAIHSYMYLEIQNGVLKFCFSCGDKKVCNDIVNVQRKSWYHISILVSKTTANVRVNGGNSNSLTSRGSPYKPGPILYIGGGKKRDWKIFKETAKEYTAFIGFVYSITVNGNRFNLRSASVMDIHGYINSVGISFSQEKEIIRVMGKSDVTLNCDYSDYQQKIYDDVRVVWFLADKKLKSGINHKIIPKVRGSHSIGALQLAGLQRGGLYICAINHYGVLTVKHAFFVQVDSKEAGMLITNVEETGARVFGVTVGLVLFVVLTCVIKFRIDSSKNQEAKSYGEKIKEMYKESCNQLSTRKQNSYADITDLSTPRDAATKSEVNETPRDDIDETDIYDQIFDDDFDNFYEIPISPFGNEKKSEEDKEEVLKEDETNEENVAKEETLATEISGPHTKEDNKAVLCEPVKHQERKVKEMDIDETVESLINTSPVPKTSLRHVSSSIPRIPTNYSMDNKSFTYNVQLDKSRESSNLLTNSSLHHVSSSIRRMSTTNRTDKKSSLNYIPSSESRKRLEEDRLKQTMSISKHSSPPSKERSAFSTIPTEQQSTLKVSSGALYSNSALTRQHSYKDTDYTAADFGESLTDMRYSDHRMSSVKGDGSSFHKSHDDIMQSDPTPAEVNGGFKTLSRNEIGAIPNGNGTSVDATDSYFRTLSFSKGSMENVEFTVPKIPPTPTKSALQTNHSVHFESSGNTPSASFMPPDRYDNSMSDMKNDGENGPAENILRSDRLSENLLVPNPHLPESIQDQE